MPLEGCNFAGVEIGSPIAKGKGQTEFLLNPSKRFVRDRVKANPTDPRGSRIQDAFGQSLFNVGHGYSIDLRIGCMTWAFLIRSETLSDKGASLPWDLTI